MKYVGEMKPPPSWEMSATIAPNIVRYLIAESAQSGHPLDSFLRTIGLTRETVDAPALRVSHRQGSGLIEYALRTVGGPPLGLRVGLRQPITAIGLLGLGMMSAATVADAVELGVRFQSLGGAMMRWTLVHEGRTLGIVVDAYGGSPAVDKFLIDEGLASVARWGRELAPGEYKILRVELARQRPEDTTPYAECFDSWVLFGAKRNALVLDSTCWGRELPTQDPWTFRIAVAELEAAAATVLDQREIVATLSARVEAALPDVLSLSDHARALAISERTLRRRLAEVPASYFDVVDEVRRHIVDRRITYPQLALADLAAQIGYTDERSLRRSVRRWFGKSPTELRRERAED